MTSIPRFGGSTYINCSDFGERGQAIKREFPGLKFSIVGGDQAALFTSDPTLETRYRAFLTNYHISYETGPATSYDEYRKQAHGVGS